MAEAPRAASDVIRFGVFELNLRSGELRKAGLRVNLQEQPLRTLALLLEHPGEVVTRDALRQRLWPQDTFVDFEHSLNAVIRRLRDTLGDSAETPRFVETVPRRGYRFIAPVEDGRTAQALAGESEHRRADDGVSGPATRSRRGWRLSRSLRWSALAVALTVGAVLSLNVYRLRSFPRSTMVTTPLTSLPGQERHPSFSPDGSQIAFSWDGESGDNQDIYIKVIGAGAPLRLTTDPAQDRTPVWSPDGRYISFVRSSDKESELIVIPALGGHERKVGTVTTPGEWSAGPSWSPDGQFLVFPDRSGLQTSRSIFVFSIANLEKRKLTSPPADAVGDVAPAISPDGRTVAFNRVSAAGGIHVVPLAGGEPRRVTAEQGWWVERLAWTANGRDLVFASIVGGPESSSSLWRVSASGGTPERLAVGGDDAANPAISIRGNRLAYEQRRQDANIWQIEVPTPTGPAHSAAKRIASTRHEAGPQFSPDGTRIAFHSDRSGTFEIWICDTACSNPVQLTSYGGPVVGTPRWSPDGRRIAFDVSAQGQSDIGVVDVDGGRPQRVTSEASDEVVPSWSRDGRWIYFASNPTGRPEVWKVPAAGGKAVQVTKHGGFAAFESTDGQFVYYSKGLDVDGVWRVPVNGGEEEPVLEYPRAGFWGYWALVETGIYFVKTESVAHPTLQFLSFAGRGAVPVATLERRPASHEPGIAVSPDGRSILYTQEDHRTSDIMLVEQFR